MQLDSPQIGRKEKEREREREEEAGRDKGREEAEEETWKGGEKRIKEREGGWKTYGHLPLQYISSSVLWPALEYSTPNLKLTDP